MCIRDRNKDALAKTLTSEVGKPLQQSINEINGARTRILFFIENSEKYLATETVSETNQNGVNRCLLYTSDAADERSSVDLGGRRIIKQKKKEKRRSCS